MKKDQKLKEGNIEVCLFPMETIKCGQGPGFISINKVDPASFSHIGSWAIDNSGDHAPDSGPKDYSDVYAPVTMRLLRKYTSYSECNTCVFTSVEKVLFPDGETDYLDLTLTHCEDISFLEENTVYEQGTKIYSEGTAHNFASHVHMEARRRRNKSSVELKTYYYDKNGDLASASNYYKSAWSLIDNEPVQSLFFINDTNIYQDVPAVEGVPKWKTFDATPFNPTGKEDGWHEHNGSWYYVINEQKAEGWQQIDGCWYYLDPKNDCIMKTGWLCTKDKETNKEEWYYFGPSGVMQGDCWVDNDNFYVGSDGKMLTSGWTKINGYFYYFKDKNRDTTDRFAAFAHGQKVTNTWIPGESWYYVKSDGKMAANETVNINGTDYHFDQSGACLNP